MAIYNIVLYHINDPKTKITLAKRNSIADSKRVMNAFCKGNKGWIINRRPNLNTWDDLVLTVEKGDGDETAHISSSSA